MKIPVYVNDNMGGGYPVSEMISVKEFTDGRKFVEIEDMIKMQDEECGRIVTRKLNKKEK